MQRTVIALRNIACLHVIFLCLVSAHAQTDWPVVGHDPQALRYSPLKQIDVHNVAGLAPAWTFQLKDDDNATGSRTIESVPLVVNGRRYVSWPFCHVAALDPETGRTLWQYTASNCPYRGPGLSSMRSVAYWPGDKQQPARILFGTEEGELYALDARTGTPVEEFGVKGIVNLKTPDVMRGYTRMHYGLTSAPLIYQDLVITGSHIDDETGRVIVREQATHIADIMEKTGDDDVRVVVRGHLIVERTTAEDVVSRKRHQHRMLDIVVERVAVSNAFERQARPRLPDADSQPCRADHPHCDAGAR